MASSNDIYTQLPLTMDPSTKNISSASATPELTKFLEELNAMHKALKNTPLGCPPPPVPVPPQRSAAVEKMRAAGHQAFRHGKYEESINFFSHAIAMALTRPTWEPAPRLKEELQMLHQIRSQANLACNKFPEALADASLSVDFKRGQNNKAHYRKAKALKEMGRLEEAKAALEYGLEFSDDPELKNLLKDVMKAMA